MPQQPDTNMTATTTILMLPLDTCYGLTRSPPPVMVIAELKYEKQSLLVYTHTSEPSLFCSLQFNYPLATSFSQITNGYSPKEGDLGN